MKTGGPILTIYTSYDVFPQGVAFGGRDDCTCINIFSGINSFNHN